MEYTDIQQLPMVLSVDLLADFLKIGKNTAYELVRSGQIKSIRIGHQYRILKSALMEYLEGSAS